MAWALDDLRSVRPGEFVVFPVQQETLTKHLAWKWQSFLALIGQHLPLTPQQHSIIASSFCLGVIMWPGLGQSEASLRFLPEALEPFTFLHGLGAQNPPHFLTLTGGPK